MTLSDLKKRARVYLQDEGAVKYRDKLITETANSVLRYFWHRIKNKNPDWAQKSASVVTVDGTQNYALPTDFGQVTFIEFTSDKVKLERWDWPRVMQDTTKGKPWYYRIIKGYIVFDPVPNAAYNLTLWYEYVLPVLSADADIHTLPEYFDELVVQRTALMIGAQTINPSLYKEQEISMLNEMAGRPRNDVRGYWDMTEDY